VGDFDLKGLEEDFRGFERRFRKNLGNVGAIDIK
jgi:hypothetical protein